MTERRTPEEESEAAAYYEAACGDVSGWEEVPGDGKPAAIGSVVTVRFPPEDAQTLRRLCERLDLGFSAVIRAAVRAYDPSDGTYIGVYLNGEQIARCVDQSPSGPIHRMRVGKAAL